jgi:excisionase family DNA binding protein
MAAVSPAPATIGEPLRLRPKDVAALYRISVGPVYEAIYRGELPAVRFGQRVWLIKPEDAAAWVDANSTSNVA